MVKSNSVFPFFFFKERHNYHLVDNSQLPVSLSLSVFLLACSLIYYWASKFCNIITKIDNILFQFVFISLIFVLFAWFLTVVYESGQGHHTKVVRQGLRLGMILFILSEIMLFFSFFWAFFHVSLAPGITLGFSWPPKTMQILDVWGLPLNNTLLLLTSGFTLTLAHRGLLQNTTKSFFEKTNVYLFLTLLLGTIFLCCQYIEYKYGLTFNWSDNVFGSIFYVTTGFHGLHVIIGTIFLLFCFLRLISTNVLIYTEDKPKVEIVDLEHSYLNTFAFTKEQHIGFEAAAWYWHFVDIVWIFLFITIYWWNQFFTNIL